MTKRIGVLYTGGTIGMQNTASGYQPVANFLEAALLALPELSAPDMPQFTLVEYSPLLDSSDMQPADWQRIALDIQKYYADVDGFVILHGTDTMAYTAAALHFLLPNIAKPVVLTGSQIPLCEALSDAPANVRNALYLAANSGIKGVSLLFDKVLLRGDYATKFSAQDLAGFSSPNAEPLLTWSEEYVAVDRADLEKAVAFDALVVGRVLDKKIAVITLYPGVDVAFISAWLMQAWDAVVLQTFGSGNAPQHPALLMAFKAASERGVLLVNRTQCPHGSVNMQNYAGGHALRDCGFVSASNRTLEATLAMIYCQENPVFEG